MEIGKKKIQVKEGSIIFIPAGLQHRFYGNVADLVVLYVFVA
jgi:quercetin dioxygenase-like cupin family protein